MTLSEKIEIMLARKHIRKTDFAQTLGITYRALANYINGSRKPRAATLNKMAYELDLAPDFLKDDSQDLELTIEERFVKNMNTSDAEKSQAAQFLAQSRGLFAGNSLDPSDKEALVKCLLEIYEDSREAAE